MEQQFIAIEQSIENFTYPKAFYRVLDLGLIDLDIWFIMEDKDVKQRRTEMLNRYKKRDLIPFARRIDNDDVACFDSRYGETVFIVHDYADEGYERREEYDTFWKWFEKAIADMVKYNEENEMYEQK